MKVYRMSAEAAETFYRICAELKVDDQDQRVAILDFMASRGLIDGVSTTTRTQEEWLADTQKNFNVLKITKKDGEIHVDTTSQAQED